MIEQECLRDAVNDVLEGGSRLGVDYDDALEYAFKDARFIDICHEFHGATSLTQMMIVKGQYCNLLREKAEFLLKQAKEANDYDKAEFEVKDSNVR